MAALVYESTYMLHLHKKEYCISCTLMYVLMIPYKN